MIIFTLYLACENVNKTTTVYAEYACPQLY